MAHFDPHPSSQVGLFVVGEHHIPLSREEDPYHYWGPALLRMEFRLRRECPGPSDRVGPAAQSCARSFGHMTAVASCRPHPRMKWQGPRVLERQASTKIGQKVAVVVTVVPHRSMACPRDGHGWPGVHAPETREELIGLVGEFFNSWRLALVLVCVGAQPLRCGRG